VTKVSAATVLALNDVSISFVDQDGGAPDAQRQVVSGVSFELRRGRVLALVGESGSGKSVTAMSTLGLLPANARITGSIRLEGRELLGMDAAGMREIRGGDVGTIFQEPMSAFNPVYTIGRQIAETITVHTTGLRRHAVGARVTELLDSVGIADPHRIATAFPHELSGGQLQRAMIAMAISSDPIALIADEPTTALDVTVQAGILDLLRELRDRLGTAVLLITHDMGVVADLADDVVVMHAGAVVEHADAGALFSHPQQQYTRELLAAVPALGELVLPDDAVSVAESAPAAPAPGTPGQPAAPRPPGAEEIAAELTNADVVYGGRGWRRNAVKAVDDVSFRIRPGQVFGLVGESGSGKSTIGRAFAGGSGTCFRTRRRRSIHGSPSRRASRNR